MEVLESEASGLARRHWDTCPRHIELSGALEGMDHRSIPFPIPMLKPTPIPIPIPIPMLIPMPVPIQTPLPIIIAEPMHISIRVRVRAVMML